MNRSRLRLFGDDEDPEPENLSHPTPLQIISIVQEADSGPHTDFVMAWKAEDGRRCQFCPSQNCTLSIGLGGIAMCAIRQPGARSSPFASLG